MPVEQRPAFFQRAQRPGRVRVVALELALFHDDGIDRSDMLGGGLDFIEKRNRRHFVRNRHAESSRIPQGPHPFQRIAEGFHPKRQVD